MARIRTIKPEFWTSEQVVECSTSARLLFIGMWNFCDDNGVHVASVKRLKMEIFPGDPISFSDVEEMVVELIQAGLLREFEAEGKAWWVVTGWHHQKIDRPSKTTQPPPPAERLTEDSTSTQRTLDESSESPRDVTERNGTERNGRESRGGESKGKYLKTSTSDGAKYSREELKEINAICDRIFAVMPVQTQQDTSVALKSAALVVRRRLPRDSLEQAIEAVARSDNVRKPAALFHQCLANQAKDRGVNFNELLASTPIPDLRSLNDDLPR